MTSPKVNVILVIGGAALYAASLLMVLPSHRWSRDVQIRIFLVSQSLAFPIPERGREREVMMGERENEEIGVLLRREI